MQAIGFKEHLPINSAQSLFEFTTPQPVATGHDLLVQVAAISVNPVDVGVRRGGHGQLQQPKIIGWDAVGTVAAVDNQVTLFTVGQRVFYAGSFKRPGSNSEYQLVDERIVALAPQRLSDGQAAAMPLTSLTAWEALFEQLEIDPTATEENHQQTILIINGAGGVGSVATQLAHWAGLQVIATASRPETINWVLTHGAKYSINHHHDLVSQLQQLGFKQVDNILCLSDLDGHWHELANLIKPSGRVAAITENRRPIDLK